MSSLAQLAPPHSEESPSPPDDSVARIAPWIPICVCSAVGILTVGFSYRLSSLGSSPNLYYGVFWLGMLTALLPLAHMVSRSASTDAQRRSALLFLGLFTVIPKYLRNPDAPLYHDEYAHWRQAVDVIAEGRLYQPNSIIPIVQFFPGTSAATSSVVDLSGMSVWSAGQLLVCSIHVLSVFAVYVLGTVLLRSVRAGAVAALVYSLNPSALYFDTQYAYESVAMGLYLWVLALGALAAAAGNRRARYGYCAAAMMCAAGCVVTHHLTTLVLLGALALLAVAAASHSRGPKASTGEAAGVWWILFVGASALAGVWVWVVASPTVEYLAPYLGSSVYQLADVATSEGDSRELLAANVQPIFERILTASAPVVAGLVFVLGLRVVRRQRRCLPGSVWAFVVLAAMYFVSIPFVLVPSGAEGARRSWAFTYVAVALLLAVVVTRRSKSTARSMGLGRFWRACTPFVVFTILAIGNVGGGLNDPYRFPGPFLWGSDTRSFSPEARTVAEQLAAQYGEVGVVSDRYTSLALAAYGGHFIADPSDAFPVWELTQTGTDPQASLAGDMTFSRFVYLVVDIRMSESAAFNGDNYGRTDPLVGTPTPAEFLARLDEVPWASRIMATEHLRVYRLDFQRLGDELEVGP